MIFGHIMVTCMASIIWCVSFKTCSSVLAIFVAGIVLIGERGDTSAVEGGATLIKVWTKTIKFLFWFM